MSKDIGVPGVAFPSVKECNDKKCPFHGMTKIRGKITQGTVVSKKSHNTIVIRQDYVHFIKKYQRYERRKTRISCHLPECLRTEIEPGDIVRVGECRKISKTKAFIVLEKIASRVI